MQPRRLRNSFITASLGVMLICGCGTNKPSDAQLTTNLKAQMFSNPQTKTADLQVAVKDGVVTLSGTAPSDAARYEAYKLAASTPGVTKVNDAMTVQVPQQTAQATPPSAVASTPVAAPPAAEPEPKPKAAHAQNKRHSRRENRAKPEKAAISEPRTESTASAAEASAARTSATAPPTAPAQVQPPPQQPAAAPQAPPQPETAVFPAGTTVEIQRVDPIDSKTGQAGDEFQAVLAQPLTWNGSVVVPKGTNVYLRLVAVQTSGQYKGHSELQLQLVRLEFQGAEYHLASTTYTQAGGSRGKDTAKTVGGGAIVGAIIGAIAGGGKGAAIGGIAGAGAGGVYQGVTKAKQIRIPAETALDFKLDQPLNIPVSSTGAPQ